MADLFVLGFALASIPLYIFGPIGNSMVIRIVHKTREMHTTTNYLLANLAVSDAIVILIIPMYFAYSGGFGLLVENLGKLLCKCVVIGDIAMASSALTLSVIAVERYHAILKPFSSNLRLNEQNIKKAIALIWISSTVLGFPGFFLHGLYFSNAVCAESTNEDNSEKKKLLMTFILATSGFLLGYGPFALFYAIAFRKELEFDFYIRRKAVLLFLLAISLCLNPVLYAFRSSSFKEGFKRIFLHRSSQRVEQNAT
ncbi:PREDICTED: neuromedin-U receptor 2-like [Acropora digitifera]|uniref:neuromedin-U receptor 2-like n=1 Tax=Acropora digitifera TaxID=70779 RepID=UPI00077A0425|nr:PREDICTED: neuromedin-U receptor 2-like [Acropora digitifera]